MKFKRVINSSTKKIPTVDDDPTSVRDLVASGFSVETALCMHDGNGVVYLLVDRDGKESWLKLKYD